MVDVDGESWLKQTDSAVDFEVLDTPFGQLKFVTIIPLQHQGLALGNLILAERQENRTDDAELYDRLSRVVSPAMATRQRLAKLRRQNSDVQEELKDARTAIAQLSRVNRLGELTAGIAHELNPPLTAIANYADAASDLSKNRIQESQQEQLGQYTSTILKQAARAGRILHSIRAIIGKQSVLPTCFSFIELINETMEVCREEFAQIDIPVKLHPPQSQFEITADRTQMQQLLVNLLQNATQAVANCTY